TPDPASRARRSLDAAKTKAVAGAFAESIALLSAAEGGPLDEAGQAQADLLRAQVSYNSMHSSGALQLLLDAARKLEPVDAELARQTYLDCASAALFAGRMMPGGQSSMTEVAHAVRRTASPPVRSRTDALLEGLAVLYTDGYAASAPLLRRTVEALAT